LRFVKVAYTVAAPPHDVARLLKEEAGLWRESEIPHSLATDGIQGVEVRVDGFRFEFITLYSHREFSVPGFRFRGTIEPVGTGSQICVTVYRKGMVEASALGALLVAAVELPRGGAFGTPMLLLSALLAGVYWVRHRALTRDAHPSLALLFSRLERALARVAG